MTSSEYPQAPAPYAPPPAYAQPRPGLETRQVLLSLGALCLVVAFSAGTALVWKALGPDGQAALMATVTLAVLGSSAAAARRLPATAEALGAAGLIGSVVDAIAVRTLHLSFALGMPPHTYVAVAALSVAAVAAALDTVAPDLISTKLAWPAAIAVASVAAGAHATLDERTLAAIALPLVAIWAAGTPLGAGTRRIRLTLVPLAVPGVLAWLTLAGLTERFAAVDAVLALASAGIALTWPASRTGAAAVRATAASVATVLTTTAASISLDLHHVTTPEAYVATPATVLLAWGGVALYRDRRLSSMVLIPGLMLGVFPTLVLALRGDHPRQAALLVAATLMVAVSAELRLSTPLTAGSAIIFQLAARLIGPEVRLMPHWVLWGAAGTILLTLGATWEARLEDVRRFEGLVRPRIEALR